MDRHLNAIHGLGYYMLGDRTAAEDIAQETFLRFWQAAPRWDATGTATVLTWLRRVATRLCLDAKRRKRPLYVEAVPEVIDPAESADAVLAGQARAARVARALSALPPRQRAAVTLSYYQHLSQKDGADILGLTVKAYESLLSRAKAALRDDLMPEKESLLS